MNKVVIGIFICLLFIGASILPSISGTVEENIFDENIVLSSWKHKTLISLDAPTPVDDYQVKIELDSSNFDYSKTNSDGSDIRFNDVHGNKLSYWIEDWNPNGVSNVWVKILITGTSNIYLYSGNNEASCESNGDDTFVFFDDFSDENGGVYDWTKKWTIHEEYMPIISVEEGELRVKDNTGMNAYLASKVTIPTETRIIFKFKEEQTGPEETKAQWVGLWNFLDYIYDNENYTENKIQARWSITSWSLSTCKNGSCSNGEQLGTGPDDYSYHTNEYIWKKDYVEYLFNDISMDIKTNDIPEVNLSLALCAYYDNTIVCDWVIVTNIFEGYSETLFADDFNDNEPYEIKWRDLYTTGKCEKINHRMEMQSEEHEITAPHNYVGIESSDFVVNLSTNKSVSISWEIITNINSTGYAKGGIFLRVTDINETAWICAYYYLGKLYYKDSTDLSWKILNRYEDQPDGIWDNQILIFGNRYHIRMDEYHSRWINDSIFTPNATLKLQLYIYAAGTSPPLYYRAGFDNIKVEVPVIGKQPPFEPSIIDIPSKIKPEETYQFIFCSTDPNLDEVFIYVELEENISGEWFGPLNSDEKITISHKWNKRGDYTIRARAFDIYGYNSPWREEEIKVRYVHSKQTEIQHNIAFRKFLDIHLNIFPLPIQTL
ncbi:DUF2341 domain-containing protein [Thermoplasmatota archaeon]